MGGRGDREGFCARPGYGARCAQLAGGGGSGGGGGGSGGGGSSGSIAVAGRCIDIAEQITRGEGGPLVLLVAEDETSEAYGVGGDVFVEGGVACQTMITWDPGLVRKRST